jgi:shikimate kinase
MTAGPKVVLVGPMGAGKTTVGEILARRWDVELRDTDADIERATGKPISEIFIDDGEPHFRRLEIQAVADALATHEGVVSLGGGAVMSADTRDALAGRRVVFLDVGLSQASSRVGLGATRPMLLGNIRGQLKTLMDQRRPLYAGVAIATVLTDDLDPEAVADAVEKALA